MLARSLIAQIAAIVSLLLSVSAFSADSTWVAGFPWQAAVAAKRSKTVEDYALLLPSSIVDCENIGKGLPSSEERKKLIRLSDVKNGYLEFGERSQLAVFKN
jgi:hypothetical protein